MKKNVLRKVAFDDWNFLLDCRNDIQKRKNPHNIEIVKEENHIILINKKL